MTAWTDHVRKKAGELGLSYNCATTDPRVKNTFDYSSTPGKATRAPRKSRAKKGTAMTDDGYVVALDMDSKERRQFAAKRMREVMANAPAPKKRKPMSEETKAMLKARREAKKSDLTKKFDEFWARHEAKPVAEAISDSIADMIGGAVSKTQVSSAITESIADMIGGAVSTMPKTKGESWKRKKMTPEAMARLKALKEEKKKKK